MSKYDECLRDLATEFDFKLTRMRDYHAATVKLLNSELEAFQKEIDVRQHIIDELTSADKRTDRLMAVLDSSCSSLIKAALLGQPVQSDKKELANVLEVVKKLRAVADNVIVVDKKLMEKTIQLRNEMAEDLKKLAGQRKVVDTLYFTAQVNDIGHTYDSKK